jgi:hypothetical protein
MEMAAFAAALTLVGIAFAWKRAIVMTAAHAFGILRLGRFVLRLVFERMLGIAEGVGISNHGIASEFASWEQWISVTEPSCSLSRRRVRIFEHRLADVVNSCGGRSLITFRIILDGAARRLSA